MYDTAISYLLRSSRPKKALKKSNLELELPVVPNRRCSAVRTWLGIFNGDLSIIFFMDFRMESHDYM